MKSVLFSATLMVASAAMAYPALKDHAEYKATYSSAAGGSVDLVLKLDISAFDQTKNEYTLHTTQTYNGQDQSNDQQVPAAQMLTAAQVQSVLANCAQQGGTVESLTVPSGTYNTCKVPQDNNGTLWIADVPFGFARLIQIDAQGNKMDAALSSFAAGQ